MNRSTASDVAPGLILLLLVAISLVFFGPVLFSGEQFGYRDSAHYYYPLYQRVQQEWASGRLPLWEPEENGGMPLLGNPTAAVLYPGKLIYALAPNYAWGARLYVLAHMGLALGGAFALGRTLGLSRAASALAALSYSFGVPVLFQYCNIIFLVGAGWLPVGLMGADRWLRKGERLGLAWLALAVAMGVLGGDPQASYFTGLCSAGYALCLDRARNRQSDTQEPSRWARNLAIGLGLLGFWIILTIGAELLFVRTPAQVGTPPKLLPWAGWFATGVRVAWVLLALGLIARWRKQTAPKVFPRMVVGLAVAALLATAMSAAQLLPASEFTSRSSRGSSESSHDIFPFSLEPTRLIEFLCPAFYGSTYRGNSFWFTLIPPAHSIEIWVPSLYVGILTLALAAIAIRDRSPDHPVWRGWMLAILIIGLAASLGEYGSPLWAARCVPALAEHLGSHDPTETPPVRLDGHLRDGDGSPYWILSSLIPGFGSFRYPSKLLGLTTLAMAMLAGLGLDRIRQTALTRTPRSFVRLIGLFLIAFAGVVVFRSSIIQGFSGSRLAEAWSVFGKFDPERAWLTIAGSLLQPALIVGLVVLSVIGLRNRPTWLALAILCIHAADLTIANARFVLTVPQSLFEEQPELVTRIEEAERENPAPGGLFRVHRMPIWQPGIWGETSRQDIHEDYVKWERRTIQPKYAIPYGLSYTLTEGVSELYDYMFFFPPFEGVYRDETLARNIFGQNISEKLIAYPRRGFDLWNTRYFVLPYRLSNDTKRGIASFLFEATELAPALQKSDESEQTRSERMKNWVREEDWRLLRNDKAYPRAWVVHDAKVLPPISGMKRKDRESTMFELLYQNDPLWTVRERPVYDPKQLAWLEVGETAAVGQYLSRLAAQPEEMPRITRYEPQRVEIEVDMKSPGIVILADVDYPGWRLTIDGKPAPIWKTNRLMRGAGVQSGVHKLVYTYEPVSVRLGLAGTGLGVLGWLALLVTCRFKKQDLTVATAMNSLCAQPIEDQNRVL